MALGMTSGVGFNPLSFRASLCERGTCFPFWVSAISYGVFLSSPATNSRVRSAYISSGCSARSHFSTSRRRARARAVISFASCSETAPARSYSPMLRFFLNWSN